LVTAHRAHFEMMTALFAARYRMSEPMPTHAADMSLLSDLMDQMQSFLGFMACNLDICRDANPALFSLLDPSIAEIGYNVSGFSFCLKQIYYLIGSNKGCR
jgi:hypothetical protein